MPFDAADLLPTLMRVILPAFGAAMLVSWLMIRVGIMDHPNLRSSHKKPTPRAGGVGILAGFLAAFFLIEMERPSDMAVLAGIALSAGLAGVLGLFDDLFTLSEKLKFAALSAISLLLAGMAGPVTDLGLPLPWLIGLLGSALWVFTLVNAVNFMDGADGFMAATLIPAALAIGVMGEGPVAIAAIALAAALAGFAVWNAPLLSRRGHLFAGDTGSLGTATIFAGLALAWASGAAPGTVFLAPLLVMPLLGDVLLTLAARAKARRPLFVAHRAHAYQLMLRMGYTHREVAVFWGGLALVSGVLALIGAAGPALFKLLMLAVGASAFTWLHRQIRRRAGQAGLNILD